MLNKAWRREIRYNYKFMLRSHVTISRVFSFTVPFPKCTLNYSMEQHTHTHARTHTYTFSRVAKRILQSNFELRPHIGGSFKPYTSRLTRILVTFIRNNVTNVFRRLGVKELG